MFTSVVNSLIKRRYLSTARALVFDKHGDPKEVIQLKRLPLPKLTEGQVLVEVVASPVNPSDINQIEGSYPLTPTIPGAIAGNEAVMRVLEVGPSRQQNATSLAVGDHCIPQVGCLGMWRSHAVLDVRNLAKVDNRLSLKSASMMSVNVFSAYRMLSDFHQISNDGGTTVVIQNGANSGVGRAVIQLAKLLYPQRMQTINVIRGNRPDLLELKQELIKLSADMVITDDELSQDAFRKSIKQKYGNQVQLGLNCIGGKAGLDLARCLSSGGTMVTYGAMSKKPVPVPASLQIFKDLQLRGFWMARWKLEHSKSEQGQQEYQRMLRSVEQFYLDGKLHEPVCQEVQWPLDDDELLQTFYSTMDRYRESGAMKQLFRI